MTVSSEPRSFLLLHGFANRRPPEHWMHWLASELTARDQHVLYPQLPEPEEPVLAAWLETLTENLETMADSSGERIVICHSLSCLMWLAAASGLAAPHRPDRVVLVSPPGGLWVPAAAHEFTAVADAPNAAAVRASGSEEVRIVCSDADPYNPPGTPLTFGTTLELECDVIPHGGHISADDGYGPWPAMLAWCLAPGGPVEATAAF